MKKRLVALAMAGVMTMGLLAGCGSSSSSTSTAASSAGTSDAGSATSTSEDAYNISLIVKLTDGHFLKVMAGAQAYADEHDNVNLEILSPTGATDYDGQNNMIETSLATDSVDGLIIAPLQSESASTLVADTDKVIVACDTDFTSDKKAAYVGTGNYEAAYSGGKAAVELAIENGIENPTVVILAGVQGDETHDARLSGYTAGVEDAGGTIVDTQHTEGTADTAAVAMEGIIQKFPEGVDIVLCPGDDMALATAKVMQDSGGDAYADTILAGLDGNQAALEAVQAGTLTMDIAQEGYTMGYKSMETIVAVLNGEPVDEVIDSGSTIVTSDNVEEYIQQMKDIGVWDE